MELLREWYFWGESDLFFVGIALIVIGALLPWRSDKFNWTAAAICAGMYILCELLVTFWQGGWLLFFVFLFAGGIALSIAVGRILRGLFVKLKNK
ncbi:MAG: hypothetical protein IJ375_03740 [Oscillospiraceae bacterium]|nr:hypothetical protein [Oscillospiraceae bacterium]